MKLILGLGNPGRKYAGTRHNYGRMLVEYAAEAEFLQFRQDKELKAFLCSTAWNGEEIFMAYPDVYMNHSGKTAAALASHFRLDLQKDLLVVVDDLALPFGKLRLRAKGSDGGHNGLKSIHALLGTPVYARLRCGIGHPRDLPLSEEDPEVSRYVLAPFPSPEKKELQVLMRKGLEACRLWAGGTFEKAANALTQV